MAAGLIAERRMGTRLGSEGNPDISNGAMQHRGRLWRFGGDKWTADRDRAMDLLLRYLRKKQ
jgi:hypothetical protein